jgi:RimJ/RimL family protein N-acetyltransferase
MNATSTPELRSDRLHLRGWRLSDIDRYAEMVADPAVQRYFFDGVLGRDGAWQEVAAHAGHWALCGFGHWVVTLAGDDRLLGDVGFWRPFGWGEDLESDLELGATFRTEAWGRGYATEAGNMALDWVWRTLGPKRIVSLIPPANARSLSAALSGGMRRQGTVKVRDTTMDLLVMDNPTIAAP